MTKRLQQKQGERSMDTEKDRLRDRSKITESDRKRDKGKWKNIDSEIR